MEVLSPLIYGDISQAPDDELRKRIGSGLGTRFNVEESFGAVPDDFYQDGVSNSTTTFTSATANFTLADVGKNIVILRAGASNFQDHHTTISGFTNSTTVTLTNATNRSQSACRFYISRGGDQTAAIQAAIDACSAAGGGTVYLPGVGYLVSGLVLKNRVWCRGAGMKATMVHLALGSNKPVFKNDCTLNDSAQMVGVFDMWIDGNRNRQSDITTTLASSYTAGATTVTLTDASAFLDGGGSILIGTNRILYTTKTGNVLTVLGAGAEGTTDANASAGATVTQHNNCGVYLGQNPGNGSIPTTAELFDPFSTVQNCYIKNCKGDGVQMWGQSGNRVLGCYVHYCLQLGIRPSWDTIVSDCEVGESGRSGYFIRSSQVKLSNCQAYFSGGAVPAEGWGFFFEGPTTIEEGIKIGSSLCSQDNKADGYYLRNAQRVVIQGTASSNGVGSAGTYCGVRLEGATNGIIDVACTERVASPNNTQQNALNVTDGATPTSGMQIRLSHGAVNGSAVGAPIKSGSTLTAGNNIVINGQGGYTSKTYATPYVPDPYSAMTHKMTLTGNLTVSAPTQGHAGVRLSFIFTQDATGGRTVTWNSVFKVAWTPTTTANKINTIDFVYDGTNWIQVGSSTNM